jgi:hypothetical protein
MRIYRSRLAGLSLTTLIFTGVGGAFSALLVASMQPLFAHEMPGMSNGSGEHQHGQVTVPPGQPVPSVKLIVHPDAMKGWNLEVKVTNFAFAPERVNTKGNSTEGHAHLYVDGKKVTRLYCSWYYLGNLAPGQHTVRVTLNTNSHESLIYNGNPIEATATIQVPASR